MKPNRRDLLKLGAIAPALATGAAPPAAGPISVHVTAGDRRYAAGPSLAWRSVAGSSADSIVVDPASRFQDILGFGAAMTDSSCYMFQQLEPAAREKLFHELFHPTGLGFDVCRICIGASDYARSAYSFDEGAPDPEMKRFSIDHDREYILPQLKRCRELNPRMFLLGSPWSPPGWMKAGGTLLGGSMRLASYAPYARYFVKFLQAYSAAGVPVDAVSVQNEVDTHQDGRMPACLWGQEYEMAFVAEHLGPQLAAARLDTRIWIVDHNYNLWGRAICELDDPQVKRYVDGVAWHGYLGEPEAMTRVHHAHPDRHAYWTEGGPALDEPRYDTDWSRWGATFAGILRNWSRCIIGWNMALDEQGNPNIGPFKCGGLVTIHSKTREITRSGQYWAFAHYSKAVKRGARRIESTGQVDGVSHVAFTNPDGSTAAVVTNAGQEQAVLLRSGGREAEVLLPADSITTLTWRS